jgi:hypothetical protein
MSDAVQTRPKPRKLKLVAPVVPEDELHCAVAELLDFALLPPAMWCCYPAGNVPLPHAYAQKLYRFGLRSGWPDLLVVHGRLYGIELKTANGVLTRTRMVRTRSGALREIQGQAAVFPKLVAAGCCIAICRSVDEVLGALRDWQVPLRVAVPAPPMRVTGGAA